MQRSNQSFWSYLIMIILTFALLILFVFPYKKANSWMHLTLGMFAFKFSIFLIASYQDPGYILKSDKISFLKLNKYFDASYLCPTCEILHSQDSRHCIICNRCVDRFDHHCPWLDNCVGSGNHLTFLIYLITMWIFLIYNLFFCLTHFDM
jgi:palmitoyltransferase